MLSTNKRGMLKTALRLKYSDSQRAKWWLKNESLIPVAKSILSDIDKCYESASGHNVDVIKKEDNRLVFRIKSSSSTEISFVAKVFPLLCLRHRLKYHRMKYKHSRFAFGEAVSLLIAAERGLNVPKVYGYGCIYGSSGLIKMSVLILEDLVHHTTIGELLKLYSGNEKKCVEIMNRVIPIFITLYKAACNYINVNLGSIMLGDEDSRQNDFILDFEYATFYDSSSLELLMFESANLIKYCRAFVTNKTINEWRDKLLDAAEVRDLVSRGKMIERFNYYFSTRLSRKKREKIGA